MKRKKQRLAAKEKEMREQATSRQAATKRTTVMVKSLWAKVGLLEIQMKTNEDKVDALQLKAEESRKELETATKKKMKDAHNKLEERLRKRDKKKKMKQKEKSKIAPAVNDRSLDE